MKYHMIELMNWLSSLESTLYLGRDLCQSFVTSVMDAHHDEELEQLKKKTDILIKVVLVVCFAQMVVGL